MIKTAEQLIKRLDKIKKVNLCREETSLEDATSFCQQFMGVVAECGVPSHEHLKFLMII